MQAIASDSNIPTRNNLVAPSINVGPWTPESVWNTGFVAAYSSALGALSVQQYVFCITNTPTPRSSFVSSYPDNNCAAAFPNGGFGQPVDPQTAFPNFLNHTAGINIVKRYLNSTNFAQQNGKPFLMFETNTASCGGLPGLSDSFGAALWGIDYGMQMAYSNFAGAMLHVGGEDDTYNVSITFVAITKCFSNWTCLALHA